SSASSTWASAKWPMRALAMTGMVTAAWISLIIAGSDMRATPPSRRMSAGTRSSAITAAAPASSAIFACSGVTTSMITPPLSISARPALTRKVASSRITRRVLSGHAVDGVLHLVSGGLRTEFGQAPRGAGRDPRLGIDAGWVLHHDLEAAAALAQRRHLRDQLGQCVGVRKLDREHPVEAGRPP